MCCWLFFFFKQKTAYEMRISDWSSDVCSSDLLFPVLAAFDQQGVLLARRIAEAGIVAHPHASLVALVGDHGGRHADLRRQLAALRQRARQPPRRRGLLHRRSEERRVGEAWVSTCRARWSAYH